MESAVEPAEIVSGAYVVALGVRDDSEIQKCWKATGSISARMLRPECNLAFRQYTPEWNGRLYDVYMTSRHQIITQGKSSAKINLRLCIACSYKIIDDFNRSAQFCFEWGQSCQNGVEYFSQAMNTVSIIINFLHMITLSMIRKMREI